MELLEVSQMKVTQGSLARLAGKLPILEECLELEYHLHWLWFVYNWLMIWFNNWLVIW